MHRIIVANRRGHQVVEWDVDTDTFRTVYAAHRPHDTPAVRFVAALRSAAAG